MIFFWTTSRKKNALFLFSRELTSFSINACFTRIERKVGKLNGRTHFHEFVVIASVNWPKCYAKGTAFYCWGKFNSNCVFQTQFFWFHWEFHSSVLNVWICSWAKQVRTLFTCRNFRYFDDRKFVNCQMMKITRSSMNISSIFHSHLKRSL